MRIHRWWAVILSGLLFIAATIVAGPAGNAYANDLHSDFSISVAGAYGNKWYSPQNAWVSVDQSNQVTQQVLGISVLQNDVPVLSFDFSSPKNSGTDLEVGYYDHAQDYLSYTSGRPGIRLSPLGFCDDQSGDFEVRDIQRNGLSITRVWITYQRWCDGQSPVFGEIRLGYPDDSAYQISQRNIRWPQGAYPGQNSYDVPVTVRSAAASAPAVTGVSVGGVDPQDFPIRRNDCTGTLNSSGCAVRVGFAPHAPGPRHAELRIATTAGNTVVPLDGFGALGKSEWVLDVDHEDVSVPDEHLELPSASKGSPYSIESQAFEQDGTIWSARLSPPSGQTFAKGGYTYRSDGTGLSMSLARGNGACEIDTADVNIDDLAFSGPDNDLDRFDLDMNAHCTTQTVQGHLMFHARADHTAPGQVTDPAATRADTNVVLRWKNPTDADFAGVLVRWYAGGVAPTATDGGQAAYMGTDDSVTFPAPSAAPVAASIWTYDTTGNVGEPRTLILRPARAT